MISSTQRFSIDNAATLISCGIDIENSDRSKKWVGAFPTFIYSESEIKQFLKLDNPQEIMSASFSLKEALFKAVQKPYNFPECELLEFSTDELLELNFSDTFKEEYQISFANYTIKKSNYNEIIVTLFLFK